MRVVALAALALAIAGTTATLAEPGLSATGTWRITPHRKASENDALLGVSCPSSDSCFAVGFRFVGDPRHPDQRVLIEHWSGDHWSEMRGPNPTGAEDAQLNAVSCPTTTSCFAVGRYVTNGGLRWKTLAMHWSGKRWSLLRSLNPRPFGRDLSLNAISCPRDNHCFAVGTTDSLTALIEHWNGSHWSRMRSAHPRRLGVVLTGVSCGTPRNCWSVGVAGSGPRRAFVEHWNGETWMLKTFPHFDVPFTMLTGVSCPTATDCFAVGQYEAQAAARRSFFARWISTIGWGTGSATEDSQLLYGLSCPSARMCVAAGSRVAGLDGYRTLIEQWEQGYPWGPAPTPNPPGDAYLYGVSCATDTRCFAVGTSSVDVNNGPYRSLMEQYR